MRRIFVYGTLLDPGLVTRLTGQQATMQPASVSGWRRVRLAGTPFPTLVPAAEVVHGALLRLGPQEVRRLQRYEGPRYRLRPITARLAGSRESVRAHAWIARGATVRGWP